MGVKNITVQANTLHQHISLQNYSLAIQSAPLSVATLKLPEAIQGKSRSPMANRKQRLHQESQH